MTSTVVSAAQEMSRNTGENRSTANALRENIGMVVNGLRSVVGELLKSKSEFARLFGKKGEELLPEGGGG